jgi:hypothetical protein
LSDLDARDAVSFGMLALRGDLFDTLLKNSPLTAARASQSDSTTAILRNAVENRTREQ